MRGVGPADERAPVAPSMAIVPYTDTASKPAPREPAVHYASDDERVKYTRQRTWSAPCYRMPADSMSRGNIVLGKNQTGSLRFQITASPRKVVDPKLLHRQYTARQLRQNAMNQAYSTSRLPASQTPSTCKYGCGGKRAPSCFACTTRTGPTKQRQSRRVTMQKAPPSYALGLYHFAYMQKLQGSNKPPGPELAPHCATCQCGTMDATTRLNEHLERQNAQYRWCTKAPPVMPESQKPPPRLRPLLPRNRPYRRPVPSFHIQPLKPASKPHHTIQGLTLNHALALCRPIYNNTIHDNS